MDPVRNPAPTGFPAKILIVDDENHVCELLSLTLTRAGYQVTTCHNGLDALKEIRNLIPDLVISDVNMDEMDGCELLEAIRREPATATLPFIMMTGHTEETPHRKSMNMGAEDYLSKPFSRNDLLTSVTTQLNKRKRLREAESKKYDSLKQSISLSLPHELLTPLTGIIGSVELLREEIDSSSREDKLELVGIIETSAQRLLRLIHKYLTYSQMELLLADSAKAEEFRQHLSICNCGSLIEEIARETAQRFNRSADLQLDVSSDFLRFNAEHLKYILMELLENACKFSKPGSKIQVQTIVSSQIWMLRVTDFGRGMTEQQLEQIDAWRQFERDTYEQQGAGLGLVTVRGLARLYNGRLDLQSEVGTGTTANLHFPQAVQPANV
jgi:signal transduction histidine kinase